MLPASWPTRGLTRIRTLTADFYALSFYILCYFVISYINLIIIYLSCPVFFLCLDQRRWDYIFQNVHQQLFEMWPPSKLVKTFNKRMQSYVFNLSNHCYLNIFNSLLTTDKSLCPVPFSSPKIAGTILLISASLIYGRVMKLYQSLVTRYYDEWELLHWHGSSGKRPRPWVSTWNSLSFYLTIFNSPLHLLLSILHSIHILVNIFISIGPYRLAEPIHIIIVPLIIISRFISKSHWKTKYGYLFN